MPRTWSRVHPRDGFIQRGQEARVILDALFGGLPAAFLLDKSGPRQQGETAEFVGRQFLQFSFYFGKAHIRFILKALARKGKRAVGRGPGRGASVRRWAVRRWAAADKSRNWESRKQKSNSKMPKVESLSAFSIFTFCFVLVGVRAWPGTLPATRPGPTADANASVRLPG